MNRVDIGRARGSRILVYHGICQRDPLRFNTIFLTQKVFETQLRFYKKYFHIVSLDDFYQQRFSREKFNLCLSFDDGFFNNYKYVLPLLETYKIPACFFVTGVRELGHEILWNDALSIAGRYGPPEFNFMREVFVKNRHGKYVSSRSGKTLNDILRSTDFSPKAAMIEAFGSLRELAEKDFWLQMSAEEIRSLSKSKWVTIGSHSRYHNDLAETEPHRLKEDLVDSKTFLQNVTGKEIKALAFPYGSYSRETVRVAKEAGHTQLLATDLLFPEDDRDESLRARLTVNPFISSFKQLHATVKGNYD